MSNMRVIEPSGMPLSLAEIRKHLNETANDTDTNVYLTELIMAAAGLCQNRTERAVMLQTREETIDQFPPTASTGEGMIVLSYPPIISVESVNYYDLDGTRQTLSESSYTLDNASDRKDGYLAIAPNKKWPQTHRRINAVTVRYVCGHEEASAVPYELKQWMRLIIGHWYANREAVTANGVTGTYDYVETLLDDYRIY